MSHTLFALAMFNFIIFMLFLIYTQYKKDIKEDSTLQPMKTKTINPDMNLNFNQWIQFIYHSNRKA